MSYRSGLINMSKQVVDKESACLNLPNEILIPLERNHKTIGKFSNADSKAYGYVWKELKRLVGYATERPSTTQSTRRWEIQGLHQ